MNIQTVTWGKSHGLKPVKRMRHADVVEIRSKEKSPWYKDFRIPADLISDAQVEHITDAQARSMYHLRAPRDWNLGGEVFPYLDRESGDMVYCRVRRDVHEEGKGRKYHGSSADGSQRIFYSHPASWKRLKRKRTTRVLVESEKAVLAMEAWMRRVGRKDLVPLGMGGCQGWRDKVHGVLPDLGICNGSEIIVLLDANVHSNPQVRDALTALVAELRSRKCTVTVAMLPQIEGVNGPDDLLKLPDGDARLTAVLSGAEDTTVAPYSEHGLVERFVAEHRENACHIHGIGWHVWDGQRWRIDTEGAVELLVQELCKTAASECAKVSEQNRIRSRKVREAVLREAQAHLAVSVDRLDKNPLLLNTPDGSVDLKTGKLRPARREDYCTKMTGAKPSTVKPARWLRFLHEITSGDKAQQAYLQRLAGQCLTGDTSEQEFYFFHGSGMNGKSEFIHALMSVLGEYAAVAPMEAFMAQHNPQHPTTLAALFGARLVTASEVEDGNRWAESRIKELTGGTPIKVRFMRQDEFEYLPQFKLILAGNSKPRLRDTGPSMTRRLMIVPFLLRIRKGKQDTKLRAKLRVEYGGILQWAIEGCLEWQRVGMRAPLSVLNASSDYFKSQDVLGAWLEERTEKIAATRTNSGALYTDYKGWATQHGEPFVMAQRDFSQKMEDRNYALKHTHVGKCFFGIRLREMKKYGVR